MFVKQIHQHMQPETDAEYFKGHIGTHPDAASMTAERLLQIEALAAANLWP